MPHFFKPSTRILVEQVPTSNQADCEAISGLIKGTMGNIAVGALSIGGIWAYTEGDYVAGTVLEAGALVALPFGVRAVRGAILYARRSEQLQQTEQPILDKPTDLE